MASNPYTTKVGGNSTCTCQTKGYSNSRPQALNLSPLYIRTGYPKTPLPDRASQQPSFFLHIKLSCLRPAPVHGVVVPFNFLPLSHGITENKNKNNNNKRGEKGKEGV